MKCPELILPAGNFEKLQYAFAYGADAVYAGAPLFSLRARENGFDKESLQQAIALAHQLSKRIYLTLNIFAHNSRVERALDAFCEMSDWGPDGFIFSDIGLIARARKLRPHVSIHLSTQANATNWAAVEFWKDLGVKRVVLPRELSLKEIAEIHEKVPEIELETFVHGAMCMAYSGRCLISNYLNHRNANEGTCTNSCRWEYSLAAEKGSLLAQEEARDLGEREYQTLEGDFLLRERQRMEEGGEEEGSFPIDEDEYGTYLMNSKDLCAIELLDQIAAAGVSSFKVEGRSKSIFYVATIARAYRQAIDDVVAGKPFRSELLGDVMSTSNRTLMTGFYLKRPNDYGENFDDGESRPLTHVFLGLPQQIENDLVWLELKNRLQVGDCIEWVHPQGGHTQIVETLLNPAGERIEAASGGVCCGLPMTQAIPEFSLLRKRLA